MTEKEIRLTQEVEDLSQIIKEIADVCYNDEIDNYDKTELIYGIIREEW